MIRISHGLGITVLALGLAVAGCATSSSKLNRLSLGMSRDEVVKVLGKPHSVAAQGDTEVLGYNLLNKGVGDLKEFAVRLTQGRVDLYGDRASIGSALFGTNAPAASR
jgi:hypothetical protein